MPNSNDSKPFPMMLRADIADEQRLTYGRQLAQLDEDLSKLVEEKSAVTAEIKQRMTTVRTQAREVARAIRSGQEFREIECFYRFLWKDGFKELVRSDTNQVVERTAITQEERQTVMALGDEDASQIVINENPRRFIELED